MDKLIKVWRFEDAPKEYRDLSDNGGDEDWVVVIPADLLKEKHFHVPFWIENLGCCSNDRYDLHNGDAVFISSHG